MSDDEIRKVAQRVMVSSELLALSSNFQKAMDDWWRMTPAERTAMQERALLARATERQEATAVPLTIEALLEALGWDQEYASHFVQAYCDCHDSSDGWVRCLHAEDLGLDA